MRYRIYEELFDGVEKKLNRIGKKCAKYGNPFIYEVVGSEMVEKDNEYYKFIIVEVEGTAKIDDYECVAILEVHEHGNVIRRINNEIDIPKSFMTSDNVCEHCYTKRRRNELYIIHNLKTNEFKQVGKNCLMLYTNGLNVEYVTSFIDGIVELETLDGFINNGGKSYFDVKNVIGVAHEIINKMGYFNTNCNLPTKILVRDMIGNWDEMGRIIALNKTLKMYEFPIHFSKNDFNKEDTREVVEKIIEYYLGLENNNEFINNIQVILKDGYVSFDNLGFLCYLPEGYNKHIKKEKQNNVEKQSQHYGEVGKRYKDINIYDINILSSYYTMYGTMYVYKITLESNDILIWKSSNYFSEDELVKVENISFTIKSHGQYKDIKQTEITRCKLNIKD